MSKSEKIWQLYKSRRQCDTVTRSGFGLCGIYEYQKDPVPNRPESVSEHALGAAYLAWLLSLYYPELFTPWHIRPVTKLGHILVEHNANRIVNLLLHHDIGEVAIGDQPDDGSQNRDYKDAEELKYFKKNLRYLPKKARENLIRDFLVFQNPGPTHAYLFSDHKWTKHDRQLIQLAKICDKFDAVLNALVYESRGYKGDLEYKVANFGGITAQDQHFIDCTEGDSSTAAVWLAHAVSFYVDFYGFREMLHVARVAVVDVRGKWFPWWEDFFLKEVMPKVCPMDYVTK